MTEKHCETHTIACYETDITATMKPVAFLNLAQEAANCHADTLGFGYDDLEKNNTVWVLSRMHVVFERLPKWREDVSLQTWHKGLGGFFYLRDFILTDAEGRISVKATSSWLIIDMKSRHITRSPQTTALFGKCLHENALEEPAAKILLPREAKPEWVAEHTVAYSDLDMNGHVNNAIYLSWAMDAIDLEVAGRRPLRDLKINFNSEIRAKELVKIYRYHTTESGRSIYYIEGRVSEKPSFIATLEY